MNKVYSKALLQNTNRTYFIAQTSLWWIICKVPFDVFLCKIHLDEH